jgi:hypothetical protein
MLTVLAIVANIIAAAQQLQCYDPEDFELFEKICGLLKETDTVEMTTVNGKLSISFEVLTRTKEYEGNDITADYIKEIEEIAQKHNFSTLCINAVINNTAAKRISIVKLAAVSPVDDFATTFVTAKEALGKAAKMLEDIQSDKGLIQKAFVELENVLTLEDKKAIVDFCTTPAIPKVAPAPSKVVWYKSNHCKKAAVAAGVVVAAVAVYYVAKTVIVSKQESA